MGIAAWVFLAVLTATPVDFSASMSNETLVSRLDSIHFGHDLHPKTIARLRAAGIDEERMGAWLRQLVGPGLDQRRSEGETERLKLDPSVAEAVHHLIEILGESGTRRSLPLLKKLYPYDWSASSAQKTIKAREIVAATLMFSCVPPTESELREAAADPHRMRFTGASTPRSRDLTQSEIDDLAYYVAAIREERVAAERASRDDPPNWRKHGARNGSQDSVLARRTEVLKRGDRLGLAAVDREYLQLLGYPGPVRRSIEATYSWGGPMSSHLMRELADLDEEEGKWDEAADLYRRGPPGGGACGTGVDVMRVEARENLIRASEHAGHCRAAIVERLELASGAPEFGGSRRRRSTADPDVYGMKRLAEAGFDVPRLFRGAALSADDSEEANRLLSTGRQLLNLRDGSDERNNDSATQVTSIFLGPSFFLPPSVPQSLSPTVAGLMDAALRDRTLCRLAAAGMTRPGAADVAVLLGNDCRVNHAVVAPQPDGRPLVVVFPPSDWLPLAAPGVPKGGYTVFDAEGFQLPIWHNNNLIDDQGAIFSYRADGRIAIGGILRLEDSGGAVRTLLEVVPVVAQPRPLLVVALDDTATWRLASDGNARPPRIEIGTRQNLENGSPAAVYRWSETNKGYEGPTSGKGYKRTTDGDTHNGAAR